MRVLIEALGSHGDMLPFIGLGQMLRARGHEVRLYSNGLYGELVRDAGLGFVATSEAQRMRDALADPRALRTLPGLRLIAEGVAGSLAPAYQTMAQDVLPGQTAVVASTLAFAAHLLAERQRLPLAVVHLSPVIFRSELHTARSGAARHLHRLPRLLKRGLFALGDRFLLDPLFAAPLNTSRATLGLPPVRRVMRDWIHQADLTLGLFPPWFARPQADWPPNLKLTGFPLQSGLDDGPGGDHGPSAELQAFFDAGPAPVVFTAGTANTQSASFHAVSAQVCAQLGIRGVLVAQRREQVPATLPPGVIHLPWAPFGWMFRRAAAVVHHGGIGSLSQALAAGTPQLIRPMAYDQFDNAQRAGKLGVARELLPRVYTPARLAALLPEVMNSRDIRARCLKVADLVAADSGLVTAADTLEAGFAAARGRAAHPHPHE